MSRRRTREIIFVCSSISDKGDLISQMIAAKTSDEASSLFMKQFGVSARSVLGPFYKKKTQVLEETRSYQFVVGKAKVAEYNGWLVKVHALVDPADHAYVLFTKRLDGQSSPIPKGTNIVPLSDLRFQE